MAPAAVKGLLGDGLQPADPAPSKLAQSDLDAAVRVVIFCDLPSELKVVTPIERWEVPPVSTDYAGSRDAMLAHIEQLLLKLTPEIGPGGQGVAPAPLPSHPMPSSLPVPAVLAVLAVPPVLTRYSSPHS